MEIKKCCSCKEEKTIDNFSKAGKYKKCSSICKSCHAKYRREHYLKNKEKIIQQVNLYRANNLDKYKNNKKAGRTIEYKCCICNKKILATKKEVELNTNKYCSKECRESKNKSNYHHLLRNIKKRCLIKSLEYNLDESFIRELLEIKQNSKCAITNIPIRIHNYKKEKISIHNSASLDRIDSSKGYLKDNVQWVCVGINYMKLDFSQSELYDILDLIIENYKPR